MVRFKFGLRPRGQSPKEKKARFRRGIASPHIRRRSRCERRATEFRALRAKSYGVQGAASEELGVQGAASEELGVQGAASEELGVQGAASEELGVQGAASEELRSSGRCE